MTMFSDIAIEGAMRRLREFLDSINDEPPEVQVLLIRQHIEETEAAAKAGGL